MRRVHEIGRVLLIAGWIGLPAFVAPGRASAEDADAKARFLAEAPEAWKKLATLADHVEVEGVFRNGLLGLPGGRPDGEHRFRLVTDGTSRRVESSRQGRGTSVFVVNPRYGFALQRESDDGPYQIKYAGKSDIQVLNSIDRYAFSSIRHAFGDWIAFQKMFSSSRLVIQRASTTRVDGEERVRVEFESDPKTIAPYPWRKGWITLAPGRLWGVRQFEVSAAWAKSAGRATGRVEYGETIGGLPSLRRTEFKTIIESGEQAGITDWQETNFTRWAPRDVPDREFTLTSFGLPEIAIAAPPKGATSSINWWFILAGLGLAGSVALHLTRRGQAAR